MVEVLESPLHFVQTMFMFIWNLQKKERSRHHDGRLLLRVPLLPFSITTGSHDIQATKNILAITKGL